jgi:hypothetical protein
MKFFLPATLAILLAACAFTPEDKEAAHQRQLEKEARENFYALKAQEHPNAPPAPASAAPTPAPHLVAFQQPQPQPMPPRRSKAAPKATAKATKVAKARTPRPDDTVYYWQVQPHSNATHVRLQVAEARYARQLAKSPEQLTPEERVWAHEHF